MEPESPADNANLTALDVSKLIALYERLCPEDPIEDDDPRRDSIAHEVYDVAMAPSQQEALDILSFWDVPDDWASQFAAKARTSVRRMKLEGLAIQPDLAE